jgi:hypothetical protein
VIWVDKIDDGVAQQDQQFLAFSSEQSGQRMIAGLLEDAFSEPLPELRLRGPKLFTIATDNQRGFLFGLFRVHGFRRLNTLFPSRVQTPFGES